MIADHILASTPLAACDVEAATAAAETAAAEERTRAAARSAEGTTGAASDCAWDLDTLREYVRWVKASFQPGMSPDAEQVLMAYYQKQRVLADGGHNTDRVTVRALESLVRMAQVRAQPCMRVHVRVPMPSIRDMLLLPCQREQHWAPPDPGQQRPSPQPGQLQPVRLVCDVSTDHLMSRVAALAPADRDPPGVRQGLEVQAARSQRQLAKMKGPCLACANGMRAALGRHPGPLAAVVEPVLQPEF